MTEPSAETERAYAALARVYDDWQDRYGCFSSWVCQRLVPELARRPSTRSFLDLGCGTGRLLLQLRAREPSSTFRLAGVDGSAAMLAQARRKPPAGSIAWHQRMLGEPLPTGPWDAIGAFFNTLNHVTDEHTLARAIRSVAEALAEGGVFVFDTNNALGYRRWWSEPQRFEGPGWTLAVDGRFDAASGVAEATLDVTDGLGRARAVVRERCHAQETIASLLADAGLTIVICEPWSPRAGDVPGATWWVAQRVS